MARSSSETSFSKLGARPLWAAIAARSPRAPATPSRSAEAARSAAPAGLFNSCVSPADKAPSASSRSRPPTICCWICVPKNRPSSRCTAIGNHSCISVENSSADTTKNRDGTGTDNEFR